MKQQSRPNPSKKSQTGGGTFPGTATLVVAVALVACGGFWWWKMKQSASERAPSGEAGVASPGVVASKPGFEILKGKWLRPDGGYIIDVKSVDESGRMDASYLNPRPINVSKAQATWDDGALKVFVEMRDANYPGSTYTLIYKPESDQLSGIYYQAAMDQSFEVFFTRTQ